jgi:enterochelin esterase-like enzyme
LDPRRRYPALYLLHGYPYDHRHWDQLGIDEVMAAGTGAGRWPLFLIVLPGFPDDLYVRTSGGPGSVEAVMMEALIPEVEARYPAEPAPWARAIGGISRGGVWALEIALRHPEAFASVGGHSPALSVNRAPPVYNPFVLAQEADLKGLRIYLDAGDADWALEGAWQLAEILKERGASLRFEIRPGGHNDDLWAGALEAYLDFYTEPWK